MELQLHYPYKRSSGRSNGQKGQKETTITTYTSSRRHSEETKVQHLNKTRCNISTLDRCKNTWIDRVKQVRASCVHRNCKSDRLD